MLNRHLAQLEICTRVVQLQPYMEHTLDHSICNKFFYFAMVGLPNMFPKLELRYARLVHSKDHYQY
jgi:hypothetical protein